MVPTPPQHITIPDLAISPIQLTKRNDNHTYLLNALNVPAS
jgi:hypothetical protein